jgi:hypothetical protein
MRDGVVIMTTLDARSGRPGIGACGTDYTTARDVVKQDNRTAAR